MAYDLPTTPNKLTTKQASIHCNPSHPCSINFEAQLCMLSKSLQPSLSVDCAPLKSGEGRQRKNSEIRCKIRPHCLYMGLKLRLHIILSNFWQLLSGGFAESQPISTCYWHSYHFDQSYPFDPVTVMVKEIQNSNCLHKLFLCISMAM